MKLATLFCLAVLTGCAGSKAVDLKFLTGTWKMDRGPQYETWVQSSPEEFSGTGFHLEHGERAVKETLLIRKVDKRWVYEATVPSQNEGRTIPFWLHQPEPGLLSFENPDHDFPKIIRYRKLNDSTLSVQVLGDDGKGFAYQLVRVAP